MDYKERFMQLIDEGDVEEAYYYLLTNDQDRYEDAYYYGNLGWVLNALERYEEAKTNLIHALELFGDDAWVYAQLGASYLCLDEFELAIENLKKALDFGLDETWIHANIGFCYYNLNQYDQAIIYYENALMDCNDLDMMLTIINIYIDNHDYEHAKGYMKQVMMLYPSDEVYVEIFSKYFKMGEYEEAYHTLLKVDIDYDEYVTLYNLGLVLSRLERYEEALGYFEQARDKYGYDVDLFKALFCAYEEVKPGYLSIFLNEVLTYFKTKGISNDNELSVFLLVCRKLHCHQDVIDVLSKAIDIDEPCVIYNLASAYINLKQIDKALALIEDVIEKYLDDGDLLQEYTFCLRYDGQYQKAIKYLRLYAKVVGEDDYFYRNMGCNNYSLEKFTAALKYLNLAQEDNFVLSLKGTCYYELKKYHKAITSLEKLVSKESNNKLAIDEMVLLAKCYLKVESFDKAEALFNHIDSLND